MPESLLNILKYLLIALIWLFFLRVLRAVWVETRSPAKATSPQPQPAAQSARGGPSRPEPARSQRSDLRLKVVSSNGRGRVFDLGEELTVGRAPACGVALEEDTFASKLHARVYRRDKEVCVEDLGSTNGTYLNSERISAPTRLRRGDRLQVGQTVFEVVR